MSTGSTPLNALAKPSNACLLRIEPVTGRIPLRNIWLLFLYAADLVRFNDARTVQTEKARDLPELVARLLVRVVQDRMRRNLSRGYQNRHAVLPRVRGRIDVLDTMAKRRLEQGRVSCRFDEHTMDTPRNRLVRAALTYLSHSVREPSIAHDCSSLSLTLGRVGVSANKPSRAEMTADQISRNETADLLMVGLAQMVFNTLIPSEHEGMTHAVAPDSDVYLLRRLFEKAVSNALRIQLQPLGWQVRHGRQLNWPVTAGSAVISAHLPKMETDIELLHMGSMRKVVIDTKFTQIFGATQYRENVLRSGYLYQLYAYLRTQEDSLLVSGVRSEGMLLHPQIGQALDEHIDIQGHRMRFKTIDLTSSAEDFEKQLLGIVVND